ncbi:hypothetical protein [Pseudomonas sp. JG-B]|uniref:hypothetical protein n=1 Tax=Pseudomonas sp. JG-B TaxID=2603214 RepID=UPI00129DFE70|nr:hypothetical protein [Pseudomonas sp. JG-B]MRK21944.1 hypothetical protein [Pseudomonas sp. JG-B]
MTRIDEYQRTQSRLWIWFRRKASAIACALSKAGIAHSISTSSGPESLQALVKGLGAKVGPVTREQAAMAGDPAFDFAIVCLRNS